MSIKINSIYQIKPNNYIAITGIYRVVFDSRRSNRVFLFPLSVTEESEAQREKKTRPSPKLPSAVSRPSFTAAITFEDAIEIHPESKIPPLQPKTTTTRNNLIYSRNIRILKYLTDPLTLRAMFELNEWNFHINEIAHQESVSQSSVRRLLSKYFDLGMNEENACQTAYAKSGRPHTGIRKTQTKLGRKNQLVTTGHAPDEIGINSEHFIKDIALFLKSRSTDKTKSNAQLYREFRDIYAPRVVSALADGTLVKREVANKDFITKGQFIYRCKNILGDVNFSQIKQGLRKSNLKHRTILGNARDRINFPGHTYIFDSTVADVYLVSAYDRTLIIGRPVIYVVIDAFSSLIVGLRITLSGPNFEEAKTALYHSLNDKTDWLTWLNLEGMHERFPRACRPNYVFADRGEFHSKASRETAISLRYAMEIAAPYRADWKSLVERMFKILNERTIHWVPGAVRERVKERGNRDARLDAVLTLHEFTRLIAIECGQWNAYQDMNKHISASMFNAHIDANPLAFWKWGLENLHPNPCFYDRLELISKCLTPIPASINRKGVFASGNQYIGAWMEGNPEFERTTFSGPGSATLYIDPDDPVSGYCALERSSELQPVKLAMRNYPNDPFTHEDITDFMALNKLKQREVKVTNEHEESAFRILQREIISFASEATEVANQIQPKSKTSRVKGIKQNRKKEILSRNPITTANAPTEENPVESPAFSIGQSDFDSLLNDEIAKWTKE